MFTYVPFGTTDADSIRIRSWYFSYQHEAEVWRTGSLENLGFLVKSKRFCISISIMLLFRN